MVRCAPVLPGSTSEYRKRMTCYCAWRCTGHGQTKTFSFFALERVGEITDYLNHCTSGTRLHAASSRQMRRRRSGPRLLFPDRRQPPDAIKRQTSLTGSGHDLWMEGFGPHVYYRDCKAVRDSLSWWSDSREKELVIAIREEFGQR